MNLDSYDLVRAPKGVTRLIPSRFPPIGAFDTVASVNDLEAVLDLEGWTNDRIVAPRLARLPRKDWVYGRPNSSVIMAAFLHGSAGGLRFSDETLGAWYASTETRTAILEVANGLRMELSLTGLPRVMQTYREYCATLEGPFLDIFGRHPEYHLPDVSTYPESQRFGAAVRAEPGVSGLRYESVRRPGHENWCCFRPTKIVDVVQADHLRIEVPRTGKVVVRNMSSDP